MEETQTLYRSKAKLVFGALIILFGVMITLANLRVLHFSPFKLWPLIPIGIGINHIRGRRFGQALGAYILIVVGVLFSLRYLGLLDTNPIRFWPLIFVFIGARIVMGGMHAGPPTTVVAGDPISTLDEFAAFSGVERRVISDDFKGGCLSAFCGGVEIDLRNAKIASDQAVIDVFACCGGCEIKVPPDWNVTVKVLPLMGGCDDKTQHPLPEEGKQIKQLIITGTVLMGGIEIKN